METYKRNLSSGANLEIIHYKEKLPFKVKRLGFSSEYPVHWHSDHEIICTVADNVNLTIGKKHFVSKKNDVYVVNPEQIHSLKSPSPDNPGEKIAAVCITLDAHFLKDAQKYFRQKHFKCQLTEDTEKLSGLIMQFASEKRMIQNQQEYLTNYLQQMSRLYEILYIIADKGLVYNDEAVDLRHERNEEKIHLVQEYVRKNYSTRISQSDVAKECCFTQTYFSRFFKENTGMTFMEYLTSYRIIKAKEMLLETRMHIVDIAISCGFPDSRSFICAFKKKCGLTPHQYRVNNS